MKKLSLVLLLSIGSFSVQAHTCYVGAASFQTSSAAECARYKAEYQADQARRQAEREAANEDARRRQTNDGRTISK